MAFRLSNSINNLKRSIKKKWFSIRSFHYGKMYEKHLKNRPTVMIIILSVIVFTGIVCLPDVADFIKIFFPNPEEIMSCKYLDPEDVLPSADNVKFLSKSIFFHETSCKGGLDVRQACAVESAAKTNPDWDINVLFVAPATKQTFNNNIALLEPYKNLHFYRVHVLEYAKDTPLEQFIAKGILSKSLWPISHASDAMRFLSLYKWGGVYLDLDVVVLKSFGSLARNWASRESNVSASAGLLAFSKDAVGRRVAEAAIRDIAKNFRGDWWGNNGPGVVTRVLSSMCSTSVLSEMNAATCNGLEVYGPEYFYSIGWDQSERFFEKGYLEDDKAYVFHIWNHRTLRLKIQKGSPYEALAKKFCPTVYNVYSADFG